MLPFVTATLALLDKTLTSPANPKVSTVVSNEPASGLLGTLDPLSAEDASRPPSPGARPAAAHAAHLRFSLDLARRRLEGEDPAAATAADWDNSWGTIPVTGPVWANLR